MSSKISSAVASYKIQIKPSAVREIEAIPQKKQRQRIIARIRALTEILVHEGLKNSPDRIAIEFDKEHIELFMQ